MNRRKRQQTPTFLEGTPGLYVKRESPPRVPSTAPTPSKADATAKTSRSLSASQNSLLNTSHHYGSSTPALAGIGGSSTLYSSAASIVTVGGVCLTPTTQSAFPAINNFTGVNGSIASMHRDANGRRLSHTPMRAQKRAPRHELSSHSFNNPPSFSRHFTEQSSALAGMGALSTNGRIGLFPYNNYFSRGRPLPTSLSIGNVVEPLDSELLGESSLTSVESGAPTPLIGSSQLVGGVCEMNKKSSITSMNGINMDKCSNNEVSTSLQSLPENIYAGRNLAPSILHKNLVSGTYSEEELPLPAGWEIETTPDGIRYYVDHNNKRTHWIHPFAAENLTPGWVKIFDHVHGIVYYNESEQRSQFEHPGLLTPLPPNSLPISALAINNPSANDGHLSSPTSQHISSSSHMSANNSNTPVQLKFQNSQSRILEEPSIEAHTPLGEDFNIIDNKDVPEWIRLYSQAPFESDHLLNWGMFKLSQLEEFDQMLMKLYKQDAINTVIKYERPRREINKELNLRR